MICRKLLRAALVCVLAPFLVSGAEELSGEPDRIFREPFPSMYFTARYRNWLARESGKPYWVTTETENAGRLAHRPVFLNDDIIAYYGHPGSPYMGILGRHSMEELSDLLDQLAGDYDAVNGVRGVRRAFYLIYGTVQPGGRIGYLGEDKLLEYLNFALERGILVFLDHQIGRGDPAASLAEMLPYLAWPNVHLALDPEWRTTRPMRVIGGVEAEEINRVQELMSRYIEENGIQGERILVVHQFDWRMIKDRDRVQTGRRQVHLVHCADGFGSPELKRSSYAYNALASNMPIKGFKLFYNFNIPGAGYDNPLLEPEEVTALVPRPVLVIYQ